MLYVAFWAGNIDTLRGFLCVIIAEKGTLMCVCLNFSILSSGGIVAGLK